MKRFLTIALSLMSLASAWAGVARLDVKGSYWKLSGQTGVDWVVLTNSLNDLELEYGGTSTTYNWYDIQNLGVSLSNQRSIYADEKTYLLVAGQDSVTVAVVDYNQYLMSSLGINAKQPDVCSELWLTVGGPVIRYNSLSYGQVKQQLLKRPIGISYTSLYWDGGKWQDSLACTKFYPTTAQEQVRVAAPLKTTTFCILDYYADSLNMNYDKLCTNEYTAVAVDCKMTHITVSRQAGNELSRPDSATINGSGPLEIEFRSNPTPAVKYYEWRINKGTDRITTRQDENTRYTFQEGGATYTVGLTVRSDSCSATADSVSITVSDSYLRVPNVFTPNGDGKNDEFRVAFKSIKEFQCYVYNRWGKKVYSSTDPKKGWNGKINGKDAASGTYFYVIKAQGEDGKKYFESGDINLIGR